MNERDRKPQNNPRSTLTDREFTWQGDWARPDAPPPTQDRGTPNGAAPAGGAAPQYTPSQRRAAARRARERRRKRRQMMLGATVGGVLVLSGIITLLLPKSVKEPGAPPAAEAPATGLLVAPLPYAGSDGSAGTAARGPDWGTVGPALQTAEAGYHYTSSTALDTTTLPAFGRVNTSWFADAAFLGDSITTGFCAAEYGIDVGGALVCGYTGVSPNTIVNRTTVNNPDRGDEVPLDVLAAAQPAKLYILLGTNALVGEGNDESFLNYYARMLDDLRAALPNTTFFVQSILPVTTDALSKAPGLSVARLASINDAIRTMCAERGAYFLDLNAEFADETGALQADYAQPDGIHITVPGYNKWVSFLCTHIPYNKNNPYQAGSTYYLDDTLKALLDDLP